jgi:hypothetical protein
MDSQLLEPLKRCLFIHERQTTARTSQNRLVVGGVPTGELVLEHEIEVACENPIETSRAPAAHRIANER